MKKLVILFVSLFLISSCEKDTVLFMLTTSVSPADSGTVIPLSRQYNIDDTAKLIAVPAENYVFDQWTGAEGSAETTIVMDSDKTVVANFTKVQYELTVTVEGQGTVTEKVIKEGITTKYNSSSVIELEAKPSAGWIFVQWKGDLLGIENPNNITIDKAKSVVAIFKKNQYALTIVKDGQGTVLPVAGDYSKGSVLSLAATAASGWEFKKWSGVVSGTDNPTSLTLNSDATVIAIFKSLAPIVIERDGDGNVKTFKAKPGVVAGTTHDFLGVTFTVVDNTMLNQWISSGKNLSTAVTTLVTDMKELFKGNPTFNTNISSWDVGSVTTMEGMFEGATSFNKDISNWETNNVKNMNKMFDGATTYDQDMSKWCVTSLSTEPINFARNSGANNDDKPVWGTWPGSPMIGTWEMISHKWDEPEKEDGRPCINEGYPNVLTIKSGENYGTYTMVAYDCYDNGSAMEGPYSQDGTWLYNADAPNYQYKVDGVDYHLELSNNDNNFSVKMPAEEQDESGSTEVWKRKE